MSPYLSHLLPVDPTLHWANPPGGTGGRDMRPEFAATPGSYTGPVPIVTHVHGSAGVGDESDGYAEAWYLPRAGNIPAGYATEGTWYDFFRGKAASRGYVAPDTSEWDPGTAVFQYPNSQRASTIWYHDHTLGMTRLNVYAGPAGFFLIRGGPGDEVFDSRTGRPAFLPGPAPGDRRSAGYRPITRSRSPSRIGRSTPTARCSIRTRGRSSTRSKVRSSRKPTSPRSGTRSSSATR